MTARPRKKQETSDEAFERGYQDGHRRAVITQLNLLKRELYGDDPPSPEARTLQLEAERLEAIEQLRRVCAKHGDNDWNDKLHLRDIIDKHLSRHLGE